MRKFLFLAIAAFVLSIFVQGCSKPKAEHMKFMDISMGQTIDKFTDALKEKGFKYLTKEDGMTILEGNFSGSPVQVAVLETSESKRVAICFVEFPTGNDKFEARNLYDRYGDLLDQQYAGYFTNKNSRYFQDLMEEPDLSNMRSNPNAVMGDYMPYFASWNLPTGEIVMRVYNTSQFQLIYADSINLENGKKEMANAINKDL